MRVDHLSCRARVMRFLVHEASLGRSMCWLLLQGLLTGSDDRPWGINKPLE